MTNNQSPETPENRLNRIEAALDRQVAVNADLRTSVTELRQTAEALVQVVTIHQQNFEQLTTEINADRARQVAVNADLRTSVTELRQTAEALIQIATIHQQNFER